MAKLVIKGGKRLKGRVKLAGNKNSALKLMAASLLVKGKTTLSNVPRIRDVEVMGLLLRKLGAKVSGLGKSEITIDTTGVSKYKLDTELTERIRASVVLAAPLLARFGRAVITPPGGDQIGERLLDTHFSMLKRFGVEVKKENGKFVLSWNSKENGKQIFLEEASVTATEMGIMIASVVKGKTVINGAATEPHVRDLCNFVSKMGVKVGGVNTNTLTIQGGITASFIKHKVIPDHIEGGTFAIAAAITGGNVLIEDVIKEDYQMLLHYLSEMGVKFKFEGENKLRILPSKLEAKRRKFQTRPWPGFPTDLMSPFIVLATQTKGTVLCHDWMYEWRMFFVDDLINMGANIFIADPHRVIVSGKTGLHAEKLYSKDIRAGMSLVLAALVAEGKSEIDNVEMIERGYERIEERFRKLGANIKRVNEKRS